MIFFPLHLSFQVCTFHKDKFSDFQAIFGKVGKHLDGSYLRIHDFHNSKFFHTNSGKRKIFQSSSQRLLLFHKNIVPFASFCKDYTILHGNFFHKNAFHSLIVLNIFFSIEKKSYDRYT